MSEQVGVVKGFLRHLVNYTQSKLITKEQWEEIVDYVFTRNKERYSSEERASLANTLEGLVKELGWSVSEKTAPLVLEPKKAEIVLPPTTSPSLIELDFNTAVVICPDKDQWEPIQAIRRNLDSHHVDIWPPHITLFYPFLPLSVLPLAMERLTGACSELSPFEITLANFNHFNHGKGKGFVTWLNPEPNKALVHVHDKLRRQMPEWFKNGLSQPHMTVARGQAESQAPSLQHSWKPLTIKVRSLMLLAREPKGPMRVVCEIPLGPSDIQRPLSRPLDAHALLALLEMGFSLPQIQQECEVAAGYIPQAMLALYQSAGWLPRGSGLSGDVRGCADPSSTTKAALGDELEAVSAVLDSDLVLDPGFPGLVQMKGSTDRGAFAVHVAFPSTLNYPLDHPVVFVQTSIPLLSSRQRQELHKALYAHLPKGEPVLYEIFAFAQSFLSQVPLVPQESSLSSSSSVSPKKTVTEVNKPSASQPRSRPPLVKQMSEATYKTNMKQLLQHLDSLQRKCIITQAECVYLKTVVVPLAPEDPANQNTGLLARTLFTLYGADCEWVNTSFEERSEGVESIVSMTLWSQKRHFGVPSSNFITVLVSFYDSPQHRPLIRFSESKGLTSGDLLVLEKTVERKFYDDKESLTSTLECISSFLSDCDLPPQNPSGGFAQANASLEREFLYKNPIASNSALGVLGQYQLPGIPDDLKFDELRPLTNSYKLVSVTMDSLLPALEQSMRRMVPSSFKVDAVESVFSFKTLEIFRAQLINFLQFPSEAKPRPFLPTLAFHGSWRRENLLSIEEAGILAPGELLEDGTLLSMFHGARYGDGVYMSPSFHKSNRYAYADSRGHGQMFVSLILPGIARVLSRQDLRDLYSTDRMKRSDLRRSLDMYISPDGEEFVFADSARILPVFLITYHNPKELQFVAPVAPLSSILIDPNKKCSSAPRATPWNELKPPKPKKSTSVSKKNPTVSDILNQKDHGDYERPYVRFRFIGEIQKREHWALTVNLNRDDEFHDGNILRYVPLARSPLHLIYILDKSASMGSGFADIVLPGCAQLHRMLSPDSASAVLFGKSIDVYSESDFHGSSSFFSSSRILNTELEEATDIAGAIDAAITLAHRQHEGFYKAIEEATMKEMMESYEKLASSNERGVDPPLVLQPRDIQARVEKAKKSVTPPLFCFVFMSDGEDTVNSTEQLDKSIDSASKIVAANGMNTIFKVVGIGSSSDTGLGMQTKLAIQTSMAWENKTVHYTKRVSSLPRVIQELGRELNRIAGSDALSLSVPYDQDFVGQGFLPNATSRPERDVTLRLPFEGSASILYVGRPPKTLIVNSLYEFTVRLDPSPKLETVHHQSCLLRAVLSLISDIKVAAVALRNVDTPLETLKAVVSLVKHQNASLKDFQHISPSERVEFMKRKRRLVNELEQNLNELIDSINFARSNMNSEEQALWLTKASDMKYGAKALRLAGIVEKDEFHERLADYRDRVKKDGVLELLSSLSPSFPNELRSTLSQLKASEHLTEILVSPIPSSLSVFDCLYSFGMVGLLVRLRRTESSNINPWNIIVEYVSDEFGDSATSMCALHALADVRDSIGNLCPDVLILLDPCFPLPFQTFVDSPLHAVYLSVAFTRNPHLSLPSQYSSLLVVSLVRSITQLMDPTQRTLSRVQSIFFMIYTIRQCCANVTKGYWVDILGKLLNPDPGLFMTEAEGDEITSVCKILGALCFLPEHVVRLGIFSQEHYHHLSVIALALLGESSSRDARIFLHAELEKAKKAGLFDDLPVEGDLSDPSSVQKVAPKLVSLEHVSHRSILKMFDIDSSTCAQPLPDGEVEPKQVHHADDYNKLKAKGKSGAFFSHDWSNCSPRAVAACLCFADVLQSYLNGQGSSSLPPYPSANPRSIFESIIAERHHLQDLCQFVVHRFDGFTMSSFFLDYIRNRAETVVHCEPVDYQIALYAQGVRFYNSHTRRNGVPSLADPINVARTIARHCRSQVYQQLLAAKLARLALERIRQHRNFRAAQQQEEQIVFLQTHPHLPKVFSQQEVIQLNLVRPKDDQLELTDGGLLRHHCCFPDCPSFLVNLSTMKDRSLGRRGGLFKHLKYLKYPEDHYYQGIHMLSARFFSRRKKPSLDEFSKWIGEALKLKWDVEDKATVEGIYESFLTLGHSN